jgi:hypothetical protein
MLIAFGGNAGICRRRRIGLRGSHIS